MDIAFLDEIGHFIVIYHDDIIVFSKTNEEHLADLRKEFEKCKNFGISLNPRKTLLGLEEGKLLDHIISKDGIRINPSRIEGILKINHPRNMKELQSFIGKIIFLKRFIPNLVELLRNIIKMLNKDTEIKWNVEAKQSFDLVKHALTEAPVLINPDSTKDFIIFSFASKHTIATMPLQKNNEGHEHAIACFSKSLRDASLKCNIMEKRAFSLVKAIKYFKVYISHSHIIAYVPNVIFKYIITQNGLDGKRGKWIAVILEYDIEIKPTKLIKGQGLAKFMVESNFNALDINMVFSLDDLEKLETPPIDEAYLIPPLVCRPFICSIQFE